VDLERYCLPLAQGVLWQAALLAHGPDTCLVATSAADALGLQGMRRDLRVIETAPIGGSARHRRCGRRDDVSGDLDFEVVTRQLNVKPEEVVVVQGLRVRVPRLTVVDAGLTVDRATALCLMDSALHQGMVSEEELHAAVAAATHRPGVAMLRELAAIADGRAESQVESRVRLACIDGGVPPDDLQHKVKDATGHLVAVGDLAWLASRKRPLLGEADGTSVHSLPAPVYRDRRRGNALVGESCDTILFVYADTFVRGYIPWAVRNALSAA
jgi:hypothetical protein